MEATSSKKIQKVLSLLATTSVKWNTTISIMCLYNTFQNHRDHRTSRDLKIDSGLLFCYVFVIMIGSDEKNKQAAFKALHAYPVELWIQEAKQVLLVVPNDVEAGVLRKVLLADGARPLQLPLPLPCISNDLGLATSIVALVDRLRYASRTEEKPLLSLKIVGPTPLVAYQPKELVSLKVKRLARGAAKLVSPVEQDQALVQTMDSLPILNHGGNPWLWPLPSLNGCNARLLNLEKLLLTAKLGPDVYKKGSFKLLRAKVATATFVRIEFQLEKKLSDENFPPEWRTKFSVQRLQYYLLAKVEGEELLLVKVQAIQSYANVDSSSWRATMGNLMDRKMPKVFLPPSSMTLNPTWDGVLN